MKAILAAIMLLLISAPAQAACNSPSGQDSQTRYDFTAHKMYYCNNTNWVEMGGGGFSNPAIGTLDMGTNRILNLGAPTANTDAATKEYVDTVAAAAGGQVRSCMPLSGSCPSGYSSVFNRSGNGYTNVDDVEFNIGGQDGIHFGYTYAIPNYSGSNTGSFVCIYDSRAGTAGITGSPMAGKCALYRSGSANQAWQIRLCCQD